jgi:hypothetical protein
MTACRYSFALRQCCFRPLKRYGYWFRPAASSACGSKYIYTLPTLPAFIQPVLRIQSQFVSRDFLGSD